jgi:16S rRNA C967 or C1407 C5-methylase (RsmB/RsmF family)
LSSPPPAPSKLLTTFSQRLFTEVADQANFVQSLLQPQAIAPCILWTQPRPPELLTEPSFIPESRLDWQPEFVDRLPVGARPGQYPWHQQGYYYCLDFSSVFAASALLAVPTQPELVIDVCAAPGGKSLFAWRSLHPQLLLSNEVIGKRLGMLISNLKRCQVKPVGVLNLDPQVLAQLLPQTAQVVIVDAPCSGQSLLAKGEKVPGCFHPVTINQNANRQKRILANAAQLVAPQGYLAYSTCTFSPAENEQVISWLLSRFPHFQPIFLPHLSTYQSHLTSLPCYRLWPSSGLGAGAFTMLLQNLQIGESKVLPPDFWAKNHLAWKGEGNAIHPLS